jgi:ribulose-5-phosphate 4-epimerase/fuculose-1-phosphate aldolase
MKDFVNQEQPDNEYRVRKELAYAYQLCALLGWDDLIYTHISVRDPNASDCYLINPFGLLFDEVTPENLIKVDLEGNLRQSNDFGYNPAGENIHGAIYKARPEVNAVVHLHTINGMGSFIIKRRSVTNMPT